MADHLEDLHARDRRVQGGPDRCFIPGCQGIAVGAECDEDRLAEQDHHVADLSERDDPQLEHDDEAALDDGLARSADPPIDFQSSPSASRTDRRRT
jgi:hypothetical protein